MSYQVVEHQPTGDVRLILDRPLKKTEKLVGRRESFLDAIVLGLRKNTANYYRRKRAEKRAKR